MSNLTINKGAALLLLGAAITLLSACGGGGGSSSGNSTPATNTDTPAEVVVDSPDAGSEETLQSSIFQVELLNLTSNQPLSPPAIIFHSDQYRFFDIGTAASPGLEQLAEGGSNAELIAEVAAENLYASLGAEAPIGPGSRASMTLEFEHPEDFMLSVATMLVNSNDAFTGISRWDVSELEIGETSVQTASVYDSGTEANTEWSGTIPGPADLSGADDRGFNPERDDIRDQVTMHPGVVTQGDGYMDSTLNESHRFDSQTLRIFVTRMQ